MDRALLEAFFIAHAGRLPTGGVVVGISRPTPPLGGKKICPVCGKTFTPKKEDKAFCSRACGEAFKLGLSRDEYLDLQAETAGGVKNLRKCHDCGRPTPDYRCAACWAKIRGRETTDDSGYEAYW